ncbi:MAG TPA: glycosyltransferase [Thermoguttaceae bacterium]|nr:glycosyltransferase [Thermoguttaceae bacterium]
MKRRILQIIPTLDRAGAEKQMSLLARGLPRDEFDVHVCVLTRGGPLKAELDAAGVPTVVIGKRWKLDPRAFWRLRGHVARLRPELIHTWLFAADAYGRAAGLACGVPRLVCGLRCVDPWKSGWQLAVDRWLARRTSRLVANSPGVKAFYIEKGLPAERIEVIPNAVEPPAPSPVAREELLAELGLPADARLVGLIGRLWPQKRVKDAIWAADLLKVIRRDVHLLIVGDGPLRGSLWHYRDQVEIRDQVHFLGERDDVARLVPHFDALWSTSGYEGQSNAVMEAMSAGVPVVATDIPGTRDLVVDGETGYLFRVGDRAALAKQTNRILDDAALARHLGDAARRRMREEFTVEKMIERYADLYRRVLAE